MRQGEFLQLIENGSVLQIEEAIHQGYVPCKHDYLTGRSLLRIAADRSQHQICRILARKGADVNECVAPSGQPLLVRAIKQHDFGMAQVLLDLGANPNLSAEDGTTPLIAAAATGQEFMVDLLIARGASTGLADHSGRTPLHFAARTGTNRMVQLLAKQPESDINAKDKRGITALRIAEKMGRRDVASILERNGAEDAPSKSHLQRYLFNHDHSQHGR